MAESAGREEFLRVALDLFAKQGFVGTSIRDIAKAMGRSVSNVYYYFETKEDLWLAILEHSIQDLPAKLRAVARGPGEPLERFMEMVRLNLEVSVRHQRESKIFMMDEERLSEKGREINRKIQKDILDIYVEQLRILHSHGLVRTDRITILAFNVLGVINWFLRWYDPKGSLTAEEVKDEVVDFVLHGMRGVPPERAN